MPRKLPNSSALIPLRKPLYSATNSIPDASAKACTVPITADSSLKPPGRRAPGSAAITSAAAMQKAK